MPLLTFSLTAQQLSTTTMKYVYRSLFHVIHSLISLHRVPSSQAMAAIALDEEVPMPEDLTIPKYNSIHRVSLVSIFSSV
jgi:hypothetical protein